MEAGASIRDLIPIAYELCESDHASSQQYDEHRDFHGASLQVSRYDPNEKLTLCGLSLKGLWMHFPEWERSEPTPKPCAR